MATIIIFSNVDEPFCQLSGKARHKALTVSVSSQQECERTTPRKYFNF